MARRSASNRLMVGLTGAHAMALVAVPSTPLVAIGLWWNANTIAHNFIHRPFFRRRAANRLFAAGLSVLLGIPQTLWRDRHLAHHGGVPWRLHLSTDLLVQTALVLGLWIGLAVQSPAFFLYVYLPGYLAGLLLCAAQGHYEHAAGTVSHYGRVYNTLFLNDGYHVEHHAYPWLPWSELPSRRVPDATASAWPAVLRWIDDVNLEMLERLVLRSRLLQRFVLSTHRRALRALMHGLPVPRRIAIVGGGLFPRTALVLRELLPSAQLTIVDARRPNLERARAWLGAAPVRYVEGWYPASVTSDAFDLVIVPLAFEGDRQAIYAHPPARGVIVHDWIWRPRGTTRIVSMLLLKRVNLVHA